MKTRISAKYLKTLPAPVANQVKSIAGHYGIKSVTTIANKASYITGEDERITAVMGDRAMRADTAAMHSLSASSNPNSINKEIRIPAGGALIVVSYYSTYYMTVYLGAAPVLA